MNTAERLVFFDLDETLINKKYAVTDSGLLEAVQEAQGAGWSIGLNSDTPYDALCTWRERFGMNGPIVAEKGAVVEHNGSPCFNRQDAAVVAESKQFIKEYALRQGFALWAGNATEALRDGLRHGEPGQVVVLVNDLSVCSLRFFVRRSNQDRQLILDDASAQQIFENCRPLFPRFGNNAVEDNNPEFGLIIVSRGGITKRSGTQELLANIGLSRCVMVGNSISDYLGGDIADHYAVANASPEYQRVATTMPGQFTEGCVSVLKHLATTTAEYGKNSKGDIK